MIITTSKSITRAVKVVVLIVRNIPVVVAPHVMAVPVAVGLTVQNVLVVVTPHVIINVALAIAPAHKS